jgi:Fe2+ transport system protein FeoA
MASSIKNVVRKSRGRPATGQDPVTAIRLSKELRETVDKWAGKQDDTPGRSEAIRRLVELGLNAGVSVAKPGRTRTVDPVQLAADLAMARARLKAKK